MKCQPIQDASIITLGPARFTVIARECLRLEYSASAAFVDQPTLFAINRNTQCPDFTWGMEDNALWIDTGRIRLMYTPNGQDFSDDNVRAEIVCGDDQVTWSPAKENAGNLGGTCRTLDGFRGQGGVGPGLLSRDGWFLLDDAQRTRGGGYQSHVLKDEWIAQRPEETGLDWYLFGYGTDYKAALRALFTISGPVPMIRRYVLGSWYCRWWEYTSDDYRALVQEYRDHDFPLDVMVLDMGWHRGGGSGGYGWAGNVGWTGFSWNRELLPDAEVLLQELHEQDIRVALNLHPHDGIRNHEDMYPAFMAELGRDAATQENLPFDAGNQSYMNAYFRHGHTSHEEMGVDFWWVDWQQDKLLPYVPGIPYLEHLPWLNYLYYRHSQERGQRGLSYSRWGGWGDHRHPIYFSGDALASWDVLAWQVPFTAISGNVGCFFWAHDTGGFFGKRDGELFTRWVQFSAAGTSLRLHSTCDKDLDRRPWVWGETCESAIRTSYHLRSQLMPYIYTSTWQCHDQGLPLIRPLYLQWPEEEEAYNNPQEYLLGDALLVAPIVRPGIGPGQVGLQRVWFPEGRWYNWFTSEQFDGQQTEAVAATLDEFPLYVRGGIPLPLQPYTPRMGSAELEHLIIRLYPGEAGTSHAFTLYEDDGVTEAHASGENAKTELTAQSTQDGIILTVEPTIGTFAGQLEERTITLELPATEHATAIEADELSVTHSYDEAIWTNTFTLPALSIRRQITLKVQVKEASPELLRQKAWNMRMAGILGSDITASSWQEALAMTDQMTPSPSDEIRETLSALAGHRDIPVQDPIPVGEPFSDPDW